MSKSLALFLASLVSDLDEDFSPRIINALTAPPHPTDPTGPGGFGPMVTMKVIVTKTEAELLRVPLFGRKSLNEMKEILAAVNLHFDMTEVELAKLCGEPIPNKAGHDTFQVLNKFDVVALTEWLVNKNAGFDSALELELSEGTLDLPSYRIPAKDVAMSIRQKSPLKFKLEAMLEIEYDIKTKTGSVKIGIK